MQKLTPHYTCEEIKCPFRLECEGSLYSDGYQKGKCAGEDYVKKHN